MIAQFSSEKSDDGADEGENHAGKFNLLNCTNKNLGDKSAKK